MAHKTPQPKDVKRALKETAAKLNRLLRIADTLGMTVVIKPDNGIPASDNPLSATKAIIPIIYPETAV